jgi:hypothetical protein
MSTPRKILDMAYGMSKLNEPEVTASETGELLPLLDRLLAGLFMEGSRINRKVFSRRADMPLEGGSWARPAGATMVLQLEAGAGMTTLTDPIPPGTVIGEVPFDQKRANRGRPSVYALGQRYYPAGNDADPVAGDLAFIYVGSPLPVLSLTAPLDPLLPDTFNGLLALEVALYLARKDGGERRAQEMAALSSELEREQARFVSWLESETAHEKRLYGHQIRVTPPGVRTG